MKRKGMSWILLALPLMGMSGCKTMSVSGDCDCSSGMAKIGTGINWAAWSPKLSFGTDSIRNCSSCETTSELMGPKTPLSMGKVIDGKIIEGKIVDGKVLETKPRNILNRVVVPDDVRKPLPNRDE
ncbi:MAG: hypothetical protein EXS11_04265 [Gemmataceae bacterium]|nr:hypothetical protein [Gemmataceae bacterium]